MAHCNLCKKKYKHGGNTTNLQQHLTRKHSIFYTSDMSINREKPQTRSESSNEVDDPSYSDASSSSIVNNKYRKLESNCKPHRDVRIDTAFQRTSSFADGGSMADRITNAVLYMIAVDNAPLSTVENDGFKLLMKTAVPLYNLPSRKTITRLMAIKYEMLKKCQGASQRSYVIHINLR